MNRYGASRGDIEERTAEARERLTRDIGVIEREGGELIERGRRAFGRSLNAVVIGGAVLLVAGGALALALQKRKRPYRRLSEFRGRLDAAAWAYKHPERVHQSRLSKAFEMLMSSGAGMSILTFMGTKLVNRLAPPRE